MTANDLLTPTGSAAVEAAAQQVLETFAAPVGPPPRGVGDAGPAILAAAMATGPADLRPPRTPADRAIVAWLQQLRRASYPGLLGGGTAGRVLALRIAATAWPRLDRLTSVIRARAGAQIARAPWAVVDIGWPDYDLVCGPAGVLLAFAADPAIDAVGRAPLTTHLLRLCADDDLRGLRVGQYSGETLRGWNYGRINMGLAHGLPGVVAALRAAADADGLTEPVEPALRRLTDYLIKESFHDGRGVLTWSSGSRDTQDLPRGASHRQAWCYGCPGIAWTLWEAGRVLGDPEMQAFAQAAAASFIAAYDEDFYLDALNICCGAAGLLVIFDAFARHTGLPGAAALCDQLTGYLHARLDAVAVLAHGDCSLQSGASGVAAALLTAAGGDRRWLAAVGLR